MRALPFYGLIAFTALCGVLGSSVASAQQAEYGISQRMIDDSPYAQRYKRLREKAGRPDPVRHPATSAETTSLPQLPEFEPPVPFEVLEETGWDFAPESAVETEDPQAHIPEPVLNEEEPAASVSSAHGITLMDEPVAITHAFEEEEIILYEEEPSRVSTDEEITAVPTTPKPDKTTHGLALVEPVEADRIVAKPVVTEPVVQPIKAQQKETAAINKSQTLVEEAIAVEPVSIPELRPALSAAEAKVKPQTPAVPKAELPNSPMLHSITIEPNHPKTVVELTQPSAALLERPANAIAPELPPQEANREVIVSPELMKEEDNIPDLPWDESFYTTTLRIHPTVQVIENTETIVIPDATEMTATPLQHNNLPSSETLEALLNSAEKPAVPEAVVVQPMPEKISEAPTTSPISEKIVEGMVSFGDDEPAFIPQPPMIADTIYQGVVITDAPTELILPKPPEKVATKVEAEPRVVTPVHIASKILENEPRISKASVEVLEALPADLDAKVKPKPLKPFTISHTEIPNFETEPDTFSQHEAQGISIQIKKRSVNVTAYLAKAYHAAKAGDFHTAIAYYDEILKSSAKNTDALLGLATSYHHLGETERARVLYHKILKESPSNQHALNNFMVLVSQDNSLDALAELLKLQQRNRDYAPLSAHIASLYAKENQIDLAVKSMIRAVHQDQHNLSYRYHLAILLDHAGRKKEAIAIYSRVKKQMEAGEKLPISLADLQERLTFLLSNQSG